MLIPVFNKESTARELKHLCVTLGEAREYCKDNNFTWRIAQLANQVEELHTDFLSEFELSENASYPVYENIAINYPNPTEVLLSFAFSTAAGLDAAHYEDIILTQDFKIKLHELSRAVLSQLHEYRREAEQE